MKVDVDQRIHSWNNRMFGADMDLFFQIVAAIGVIASAFFGVIALVNRRETKKLQKSNTNFDWAQMLVAADVIAKELRQENFLPDMILAIEGGGGIFANLISIELGETIPITSIHIRPLHDPQADHEDGPQDDHKHLVKKTTKWLQFIPQYLKHYSTQKVLILDDYCITGSSLASLRSGLEELGFAPDKIKTGVAICTQGALDAASYPDFFWLEVETARVNFPWGPGQKLIRMGQAPSMTRK